MRATLLAAVAGFALGSCSDSPAERIVNPGTINPAVLMRTSKGDIRIELFEDEAPVSVANYLAYVDDGFYDGSIFHRVIRGFVIQGGGYTADFTRKQTGWSVATASQGRTP